MEPIPDIKIKHLKITGGFTRALGDFDAQSSIALATV